MLVKGATEICTAWFHYNSINVLQSTHNVFSVAHPSPRHIGVFLGLQAWFIFCLFQCFAVCIILCVLKSNCTNGTYSNITQRARFMGPTWGPPGSWRPQMGPMLAPLICYLGASIRSNYCSVAHWTPASSNGLWYLVMQNCDLIKSLNKLHALLMYVVLFLITIWTKYVYIHALLIRKRKPLPSLNKKTISPGKGIKQSGELVNTMTQ